MEGLGNNYKILIGGSRYFEDIEIKDGWEMGRVGEETKVGILINVLDYRDLSVIFFMYLGIFFFIMYCIWTLLVSNRS